MNMVDFLAAVEVHRTHTPEALIDQGVPPKVIYAKAEKASRKGYTDYGVVADRCWLTDKGRNFLAAARVADRG